MAGNLIDPPKPHGGRREGAGRKAGTKNVLPKGAVAALKAAGLRVPVGAPEGPRELADRALVRMAEVLEGKVYRDATAVLTAARAIREEVCGPVVKKLEHAGPEGAPLRIEIVKYLDDGDGNAE